MAQVFEQQEGTPGRRRRGLRRTVDASNTIPLHLNRRVFWDNQKKQDEFAMQPHNSYVRRLYPPDRVGSNPAANICTYWIKTSTNRQRSPVNALCWTPEATTRCITGNASGEFTLWKDGAFNFERIMQAHDSAIRAMTWSHNANYLISSDNNGVIKYWEPSMTNVQAFTGHGGQPIRGLSFSPMDSKFVSCSDDSTVRVWDWALFKEEVVLTGHGWDVRSCEWHPFKSLIASGSKDNLIKLWDPRTGTALSTLYGHKNTVQKVRWNQNGNWLLSAARDQLLKLYDIRTMKEMESYRGHGRDVTAASWHPQCERLFMSGGYDGTLMYWIVGSEKAQATIPFAHDETAVWDIGWHPLGHLVATGSNDHSVKFWARNRPGDPLGILPEVDEGGHEIEGTGGSAFETGHQFRGDEDAYGPGAPRAAPHIPGVGSRIMAAPAGASSLLGGHRKIPPDSYTCNKCGQKGHYIQDCTQANTPPPGYICYTCRQGGHYKKDCPNAGFSQVRSQRSYGGGGQQGGGPSVGQKRHHASPYGPG